MTVGQNLRSTDLGYFWWFSNSLDVRGLVKKGRNCGLGSVRWVSEPIPKHLNNHHCHDRGLCILAKWNFKMVNISRVNRFISKIKCGLTPDLGVLKNLLP